MKLNVAVVKEVASTTMLVVLFFGAMLGIIVGVWCATSPITPPYYILTVSDGTHTERRELVGRVEDCESVQTAVVGMVAPIASNIHITCSPTGDE